MILCLVIPNQLLGMFTDNPETIKAGVIALRIISIGFIVMMGNVLIIVIHMDLVWN